MSNNAWTVVYVMFTLAMCLLMFAIGAQVTLVDARLQCEMFGRVK